jgi:dTDP-glucose 4,6-dehydratase
MRKFKNILVTGGGGFIGLNFVKRLLARQEQLGFEKIVVVDNKSTGYNKELEEIDHPSLKFVELDLYWSMGNYIIFSENDIDCVVHFAATSHVDRSIDNPVECIKNNIISTTQLLEDARQYFSCIQWKTDPETSKLRDTLFHYISTDEVFGEAIDEKFSEDSHYNPRSRYSASKAAGDHLVRAYHHTYDLNVTISNCGNNYGPFQNEEKLIPKVISNAVENKDIPVYGDGKQQRNWLYVEDHCSAIEKIIYEAEIGKTYMVGSENTVENIEIVKKILGILGKPLGLIKHVDDRLGHDVIYDIDSKKIQKELKWETEVSFDEGIQKTVDFYLKKMEK